MSWHLNLNRDYSRIMVLNRKFRVKIICCFSVILVIVCGVSYAQKITATQMNYNVPVLTGKTCNLISVLRINSESPEDVILNEVNLLVSQSSLSVLEKVDLWSVGSDSSLITKAKLPEGSLFATEKPANNQSLKLKGSYTIKKGLNFLWLGVSLRQAALPSDFLNIKILAVKAGQNEVMVKSINDNVPWRVGIALRQHNEENVHTHRIPGLTTVNDGSLLATYDARRTKGGDLQGDIDIGLSRSLDKGKTWLPMQVVMDMGEWGGLPQKFNGVSDACILSDKKTGTIYIAGLWMHGVLDDNGKWIEGLTEKSNNWNHQWRDKGSQRGFDVKQTSQFLIVKSTDYGKTWSKPVNITRMCKKEEWWLLAPAPGSGITLRDGTLVFPTQGRDAAGKPFSNITYSKDGGKTWKTSNPATDESTTENMAVELSDGALMLNMRANSNRTDTSNTNGRAIAVTNDLGQKWEIHPTSHKALQEPTCMASIIRHDYVQNGRNKSILVFCNPDSKVARNNISIKVSHDDGKTWSKKILLDEQKSRGYSCLTSIDTETIGVLYESSQADLVFQTIKLKELL